MGGSGEKRPLIERILTFADYKNLYTHFLDFISHRVNNIDILIKELTSLKKYITPLLTGYF